MSDTSPRISVITPSYNQGEFLDRTIRSVLSQKYPNLEYIIIDGGSSDDSAEIIRKHEGDISYWVSEKDRGQTHAVNKGLAKASGEIIGWLNSDDIYLPATLARVAAFFRQNPEADILYGRADHIDAEDKFIEEYPTEPWDYERLKVICYLCQPAVFFRRSLVDRVGVLDETLHYCMDYEYWLRIGRIAPFAYFPEKLAGSRLYPSNKTLGSRLAVHDEILTMMKKKYGSVPRKWLFAHAHIKAESAGNDLSTLTGKRAFLRRAILQWHKNLWRYNHTINPLEIMEDVRTIRSGNTGAYQSRFDQYRSIV